MNESGRWRPAAWSSSTCCTAGRLDEADALAGQLLELFPASARLRLLAGQLAYRRKDYAAAELGSDPKFLSAIESTAARSANLAAQSSAVQNRRRRSSQCNRVR